MAFLELLCSAVILRPKWSNTTCVYLLPASAISVMYDNTGVKAHSHQARLRPSTRVDGRRRAWCEWAFSVDRTISPSYRSSLHTVNREVDLYCAVPLVNALVRGNLYEYCHDSYTAKN